MVLPEVACGFELVSPAVSFEEGWFLPGVDHELMNLGPLGLQLEMVRIAGWFRQVTLTVRPTRVFSRRSVSRLRRSVRARVAAAP